MADHLSPRIVTFSIPPAGDAADDMELTALTLRLAYWARRSDDAGWDDLASDLRAAARIIAMSTRVAGHG